MQASFLSGNQSRRPRLLQGWQRSVPGGIAALVVGSLFWLGVLVPVEQAAYQALFHFRGAIPWDERVVVVAIDDESLRKLGRFPWERRRYAALLDVLSQAQPAAVVFDLLFSESSPDDGLLAAAIERQGQVVLAQSWDSEGVPLLPSPRLETAALAGGHVYQRVDADGVTRAFPEQVQDVPALSLIAAQIYRTFEYPGGELPPQKELWLNWPGPVNQLTHYSFSAVLQGQVPATAFKHKIVLIGMTATGNNLLHTPFDRNPPAGSVHLHAAAISNLLQQNYLHTLPREGVLLGLLLSGPVLSFVVARWSAARRVLFWIGLAGGWIVFAAAALNAGYWLPVAPPLLLLGLTWAAVGLGERLRLNTLLEREVERFWQMYQQHASIESLVPQTEAQFLAAVKPELQQHPNSLDQVVQLSALAEYFSRSQSAQTAIAYSLRAGLLAADLDGRVWFCNPTIVEWLQLQPGDNLTAHLVPRWYSPDQWRTDLDKLCASGSMTSRELASGERWFEAKLQPLSYLSQTEAAPLRSPTGLLLLMEDITLKKQAEEKLSLQMQELQQLNLSKDDFLSLASHELRAPMANMKVAIGLLEKAPSREKLDNYLQILKSECAREIKLINNLLDLQRLDATMVLSAEPLNLPEWLPLVTEPFYGRAQSRKQHLRLQIEPTLPPLVTEPGNLERILVELLNNACKYAPPGAEITLTARAHAGQVAFVIHNTGSEIAQADLPRIYEKFYRIRGGDRWEQGGTGLGLALVKKLVDHLGGRIEATSQDNQTCFTVCLPLQEQAENLE